jgi:hypothetical protein
MWFGTMPVGAGTGSLPTMMTRTAKAMRRVELRYVVMYDSFGGRLEDLQSIGILKKPSCPKLL